jgi:hypothetical protein
MHWYRFIIVTAPKIDTHTGLKYRPALTEANGAAAKPFKMGAQVQVVTFYMVGIVNCGDVHCRWYKRLINIQLIGFYTLCAAQQQRVHHLPQHSFVPFAHRKIDYRFGIGANGVGYSAIDALVLYIGPYFIHFESRTVEWHRGLVNRRCYKFYPAQYRGRGYAKHTADTADAHTFTDQNTYLPADTF